MKFVWFLFSLTLLVGCNRQQVTIVPDSSLPVLDITADYPEREIDLTEEAEIEYIPLQFQGKERLELSDLLYGTVSEHLIIAYNREGTVFVFDKMGKQLHQFNPIKKEKKPYDYIFSIYGDEENQEIFIKTSSHEIKVYSLAGNYNRSLKVVYPISFDQVFGYSKDTLIVSNGTEDVDNSVTNGIYYYKLSKKNAGLSPFPFYVKRRITNRFTGNVQDGAQANGFGFSLSVEPMIKNGNEIILSDFACDTIFSFDGGIKKALLRRTPAVRSTFPLKLIGVIMKTDRYMLMNIVEKVYVPNEKKIKVKSLLYDFKTQEIVVPKLINKEFTPLRPVYLENLKGNFPKNTCVAAIHSKKLFQLYESGRLSGKAKEVASRLGRDDTLVLILHRFK